MSPATAISIPREGTFGKRNGMGVLKNDKRRRIPGVYPRIIKQKKLSQLSKVSQERREWKTNLQSPPSRRGEWLKSNEVQQGSSLTNLKRINTPRKRPLWSNRGL
ncbi:hypothetical protein NPIL_704061 [Nephila pilipes]|uniref:Uncharacterized protein n=1 Tax=Nephila pilipes TaxID=299642 RepID=A0A8X6I5L3_NEPPI|nr:hypothetical protein NPIL_704061 [Nephila pilipes]